MPPTNNQPCALAADSALAGKHSLFPRAALALPSSGPDSKANATRITALQPPLALAGEAPWSDYFPSALQSVARFIFSRREYKSIACFLYEKRNGKFCSLKNVYLPHCERWLRSHCGHLPHELPWNFDGLFTHQSALTLEARYEPPGQKGRDREHSTSLCGFA